MTVEEALDLLRGGPEGILKWNEWRNSNRDDEELPHFLHLDLENKDLTNANLSKMDLSHSNLIGAILCKANLSKANLSGAFLTRANLHDANLSETDFSNAEISNANLSEADLTRSNFSLCHLEETDFSNAIFTEAIFIQARLCGAILNGAYLAGNNLDQANLSGAKMQGANLSASFLRDSWLINTNLSNAQLFFANLKNSDLTNAILAGANLLNAQICNAKLNNAILTNSELAFADFTKADLSNADLSNAKLTMTRLGGAKLQDCQLHGTDLSNCDGRWTSFSKAHFSQKLVRFTKKIPRKKISWEAVCFAWSLILFLLKWLASKLSPKLFNWQTVRSVGALQVLTKASYFMLAFVPLLTGAWQGVKLWVDQSQNDVREVLYHIDRSADSRQLQINSATPMQAAKLRASIVRLQHALEQREKFWLGNAPKETIEALKTVDEALDHLEKSIATEVDHDAHEIHKATSKLQSILQRDQLNPKLPSSWAIGFFASLFVVLGHFVYQVWCPELVKSQTEDNFAYSLLSEFSGDSERHYQKDQLTRATNSLDALAKRLPSDRHRNLVQRHANTYWIPSNLNLFEPLEVQSLQSDEKSSADSSTNFPINMAGLGLMRIGIEEGARAEYFLKSLENPKLSKLALFLYFFAGLLICCIVTSQSLAVMKSAKWLNDTPPGNASTLILGSPSVMPGR